MTRAKMAIVVGIAATLITGGVAVMIATTPAIDRCDDLESPDARDDCRLAALQQDGMSMDEVRASISRVESPQARDELRLRLIVLDPDMARSVCPQMEGSRARDWCQRIMSRPHLSNPVPQ